MIFIKNEMRQPVIHASLDRSFGKGNKTDVIICTGCGNKNDDENRSCEKCGKKLQSARQQSCLIDYSSNRLDSFTHKGVSPQVWSMLMRMVEAWAYVAVLAGVAAVCITYELWWPMYPAVGVLGFIAWLRRI